VLDNATPSGGEPRRVAFSTLGCKVNSSETESFMSTFLDRGYRMVQFEDEADVYVVNTCTVTTIADRKSRQEIRQAGRANPLALVAATGCYVSVANRELGNLLPGNLLVVPNRDKDRLVDLVEDELALRQSCTGGSMAVPVQRRAGRAGMPAPLLPVAVGADQQRTRATLKIQDGCNAGCTFCIIPRARGGPRSVPMHDVVDAALTLESHGYREIVLTGILLGSYGRDLPGSPTLATLLTELLGRTSRLRIRISSIEPQDLDPGWFEIWHDQRMCRHLHVPLQSGSDTILLAMRRHYDVQAYKSLIAQARDAIADLAVTTDLLVGFPGEDERCFEETAGMLERVDFAGIHVFRYSARPGTPAARMPDQIADSVKAARSERVRALAADGKARFHRRFVGSTQDVLWEDQEQGVWHGLTSNYLSVFTRARAELRNTLVPCRLACVDDRGLWTEPVA
jgi:threonylcarbamoyladenosine tRNA methylthiotransferase MtaB